MPVRIEHENGAGFWNRSDETHKGTVGKLTEDQTRERCRFHAMRYATGKPTIQEIAQTWMDKYGISMHYNTEKEWAWRNEDKILDMMNRMVDSGELKIALTDVALLQTMSHTGRESGRMIKSLEARMKSLIDKVDWDFDPFAVLNIDEAGLFTMEKNARDIAESRVKTEAAKNKLRFQALRLLGDMVRDQKKLLIETVMASKDLLDDSRLKERKIEKEIEKRINKNSERNSEFDPLVEVDDSMRNGILENGGADPG